MDDEQGRRRLTVGEYFSTAFTAAATLAVAFAIGFYGGQWLDRRLSTYPWLTLLGLGLGVTAGFRTVLRELAPDLFRRRDKPGKDKP
ncbi:MAG: AtpZ/AtpI family protein [Bacillota bacterium]